LRADPEKANIKRKHFAMSAAAAIRLQIESALSVRIPAALTLAPRVVRPLAPTGIDALDEVLRGGLPLGAITELVGPECSGRTTLALKFVAGMTQAGRVCAWIDLSNALDPASAAAAGVILERLLWVRCGTAKPATPRTQPFSLPEKYLAPAPAIKGLHGGGCGGHPRGEVKGLARAVSGLLRPETQEAGKLALRCIEPQRRERRSFDAHNGRVWPSAYRPLRVANVWARLDQALRATDLLLQAGGFSAIVLDLGSMTPEFAARVPLATWFRYRAAAERTQASILLLAQCGCAKSSAELSLRMEPGEALCDEATVFTGMTHRVEVARRRFASAEENVVPLRKPPQRVNVGAHAASWQSRAAWAGVR